MCGDCDKRHERWNVAANNQAFPLGCANVGFGCNCLLSGESTVFNTLDASHARTARNDVMAGVRFQRFVVRYLRVL